MYLIVVTQSRIFSIITPGFSVTKSFRNPIKLLIWWLSVFLIIISIIIINFNITENAA